MFPSPTGVLYISIGYVVPDGYMGLVFPSPIGVLYISILQKFTFCFNTIQPFPSPIGVLYISMKYVQNWKT